MKFNRAIVRIGAIVTILILLLGLPSWLFTTITASAFSKTGTNILLGTISFSYFIILMLCTGLAAFWLGLLIINFGIQIGSRKTKIIYFLMASPFIVGLTLFFMNFTILPLGKALIKLGNV